MHDPGAGTERLFHHLGRHAGRRGPGAVVDDPAASWRRSRLEKEYAGPTGPIGPPIRRLVRVALPRHVGRIHPVQRQPGGDPSSGGMIGEDGDPGHVGAHPRQGRRHVGFGACRVGPQVVGLFQHLAVHGREPDHRFAEGDDVVPRSGRRAGRRGRGHVRVSCAGATPQACAGATPQVCKAPQACGGALACAPGASEVRTRHRRQAAPQA